MICITSSNIKLKILEITIFMQYILIICLILYLVCTRKLVIISLNGTNFKSQWADIKHDEIKNQMIFLT